jgi:hypothetical protein
MNDTRTNEPLSKEVIDLFCRVFGTHYDPLTGQVTPQKRNPLSDEVLHFQSIFKRFWGREQGPYTEEDAQFFMAWINSEYLNDKAGRYDPSRLPKELAEIMDYTRDLPVEISATLRGYLFGDIPLDEESYWYLCWWYCLNGYRLNGGGLVHGEPLCIPYVVWEPKVDSMRTYLDYCRMRRVDLDTWLRIINWD